LTSPNNFIIVFSFRIIPDEKIINKKLGKVNIHSYIMVNIKINKMKYNNVKINLKPLPILEELIEDLTNKYLTQKAVLANCGEYADPHLVQGLEKDIKLLDEVLERVYDQQELINLRSEQIIGLN
jgi:hypothetical protein